MNLRLSFRSLSRWPLACAAFHLACATARATSLGLSTDPIGSAWDRLDPNSGFAIWDQFQSASFTNAGADSGSGITSAALSQPTTFTNFAQGAGTYNAVPGPGVLAATPGDILFPGGNTVNFTITGQVSFTIYGLSLQIKRAGSTGTLADANGFSPTLSIDGGPAVAPDQISTTSGNGDSTSTGGTWSVTTWYWGASLAGDANTGSDTFALSFSKSGSQRTLDGMAVDVGNAAVVPEPSALLLAGGASALLALRRRRPKSARPPAAA